MLVNARGQVFKKGDVIDIHQTVCGYNKFAIMNTNPLIVYYVNDDFIPICEYEYSLDELLQLTSYDSHSPLTIVRNIKC